MKKSLLNLTLLAAMMVASSAFVSACSGGDDDDDDDDDGARPVAENPDGNPSDFSSCTAPTLTDVIDAQVEVGLQGVNPASDPTPFEGATVVLFDAATGNTMGGFTETDGDGLTMVTVTGGDVVSFRVTSEPDGVTVYVPTYNYNYDAPATETDTDDPDFELRLVPESTRNAIKGVLTNAGTDITGTMQVGFAAYDCAGDAVVGATILVDGTEPPRCEGPGGTVSTLPCVSYSTNLANDWTDASGQYFIIGLSGDDATLTVQAITSGGTLSDVGEFTVAVDPDTIAVGSVPAANASN